MESLYVMKVAYWHDHTFSFLLWLDFVLDLARNGEMQSRISSLGSLSLACVKYYGAQVVDALTYMHSKDVIHRSVDH
jgi:serine/threonine protein kinase